MEKVINVKEALDIILQTTPIRKVNDISISNTNRSVLATKIISQRDQPPFNRVAMDGIAVNVKSKEIKRYIESVQAAGETAKALTNQNHCIEAMTGAPLPDGCDCIIPYENIQLENGYAKIDILDLISGNNIHKKGSDYKANETILEQNTKMNSAVSAIICSQGQSLVPCYQLPRIVIISSGSELVALDQLAHDHQIYGSNSYAIEHELKNFGITQISKIHIPDNSETTEKIIQNELDKNDIIIVTGGVSKGKFDYIPEALKNIGVKKLFHKIKQKPGKPMWYGVKDDKQIFALPGNPVSCLICLRRYVLPSIDKSMNRKEKPILGRLTQSTPLKKDFTLFVPVIAHYTQSAVLELTPISGNGSGDFYSLAKSDGFIELTANSCQLNSDSAYPFFPWK